MLRDPFYLRRKLQILSYLDRVNLPKVKKLLFDYFFIRFESVILPIYINHFIATGNDKSVLLVGNASNKENYNSVINSFNGDVVRFNRFKNKEKYGLGCKVTHCAISNSFIKGGNMHADYFTKNGPDVKVFVASYPVNGEIFEKISVLDTKKGFQLYKEMCDLYMKSNGVIFPYDDAYFNKHKAFKPSTGLLTILSLISVYENIKIINFDGFFSDHYWKEVSDNNSKKYKSANMVSGNHQPILERSIVETLLKNKIISVL
jgi:hypothetical protein